MARVPYHKLLTNLARAVLGHCWPYWEIIGRFSADLAALGPYYHDPGPIFPRVNIFAVSNGGYRLYIRPIQIIIGITCL